MNALYLRFVCPDSIFSHGHHVFGRKYRSCTHRTMCSIMGEPPIVKHPIVLWGTLNLAMGSTLWGCTMGLGYGVGLCRDPIALWGRTMQGPHSPPHSAMGSTMGHYGVHYGVVQMACLPQPLHGLERRARARLLRADSAPMPPTPPPPTLCPHGRS